MEIVFEENPCGGKGTMKLEKILDAGQLADKCGLYARVTLPPGAVLGFHEHHGNSESSQERACTTITGPSAP